MFTWEEYIQADLPDDVVESCRSTCASVFQHQKETIKDLASQLKPHTVACLGSGCLNDIPIFDLYKSAKRVYLVDWLPGISEKSLNLSLIEVNNSGFSCEICRLACDKTSICTSYTDTNSDDQQTCAQFVLQKDDSSNSLQCRNFAPGEALSFQTGDVTAARASQFAKSLPRLIELSTTPQECLKIVNDELLNFSKTNDYLPIQEGSIDLVTSSMVISQFDHEPFDFFTKNLIEKFGFAKLKRCREEMIPLSESFRNNLFSLQLDGHMKQLRRLVRPKTGRVFLSVELFRTLPNSPEYFLAKEISNGLELVSNYFSFDFNILPWNKVLHQVDTGDGGSSIIQSYVLTPK